MARKDRRQLRPTKVIAVRMVGRSRVEERRRVLCGSRPLDVAIYRPADRLVRSTTLGVAVTSPLTDRLAQRRAGPKAAESRCATIPGETRGKRLMELVNHPLVAGPAKRAGLFWFTISPLFIDPVAPWS